MGRKTERGQIMMNDLEKFWRDAPAGTVVCAETGATKNMVLNSVIDGAKDLDSLRKTVPLCRDDSCSSKNPSGRGCSENAEMLLSIYAPIFEFMKEAHSHDHGPDCRGKSTGSCGSCKLCQ